MNRHRKRLQSRFETEKYIDMKFETKILDIGSTQITMWIFDLLVKDWIKLLM